MVAKNYFENMDSESLDLLVVEIVEGECRVASTTPLNCAEVLKKQIPAES